MRKRQKRQSGYSLIELTVVIVIIGIIATVAMRSMRGSTDVGRVEDTKRKLERIAHAICGDPNLVSGGTRTNYGYVGDVGSLPPTLDALISNPGGYATWKGPYIVDDLTSDGTNSRFKKDAWGQTLTYSAGTTVMSSGGPVTITRPLGSSAAAILRNPVTVTIFDLAGTPPGTVYRDSVKALLDVPNGTGSVTTKVEFPAADGYLRFDSIPIGERLLRVVYMPYNDTLRRHIHVDPGSAPAIDVQLFRKVW